MCVEKSPDGWEEKCLQCSYIREYETYPPSEKEACQRQSAPRKISEDRGGRFSETNITAYDKTLEIFLYSKSS